MIQNYLLQKKIVFLHHFLIKKIEEDDTNTNKNLIKICFIYTTTLLKNINFLHHLLVAY